ncbi:ribosome biogenesis GTP-binding protein YihA/YsxC [Aquabacterium sp. A3]|uniref:ribosome biogenesis GTP-binding protein YihA/YsxC n=1 Tax=Aquabacterium sp. A3 TaxID=3132829 RepID=UPI003119C879
MPRPANPRPKSNPRHSERSQTPPAPALNRGDEATADPARLALAWAHTARFLTTAAQLNQLPVNELPEVAFVGRSNAGKSTAINTLAQQRQLAYASKTPGRTQHINLFEVGPKDAPNLVWTDLPGYGYAAVEREAKVRWQQVMARYLEIRRNLTGVVQMVDSRHGFTELDLQLLSFVAPRVRSGEVKLLVLLTKADKLNKKEQAESLAKAQEALGTVVTDEADVGITLFSALKKIGVGDVAQVLQGWAADAMAARASLAMPDELPPDPTGEHPEHLEGLNDQA